MFPSRNLRGPVGVLGDHDSLVRWIHAVKDQFRIPAGWDDVFDLQVRNQAKWITSVAMSHRGDGPWDAMVTQVEWALAASSWDASSAVSPDLLPRCVFGLDAPGWLRCAWLCQRLCGPLALAVRPHLWRLRKLLALFKKGAHDVETSYRFITIMQQHGLLQEHILAARVIDQMRASISMYQSGYMSDVSDPKLCLHELAAQYKAANRVLLAILGDLIKAFPRAWRDLLLERIHTVGGFRDGMMALIASILSEDEWLVTLSGVSWVRVKEGVPEGSRIGPPSF